MNKFIAWLIMRKIKTEAGQLEARGISVTKVCAVLIALMKAFEFSSPYFFEQPIVIPQEMYGFVASIGAISLKEGVDRSAPTKTSLPLGDTSSSLKT